MSNLEALAVGVHGTAAALHAEAAVTGAMTAERRGAAIVLHGLGIAHNLMGRSPVDVAAHVFGIAAAFSRSRAAHAIVCTYDAVATAKHARRCSPRTHNNER